MLKTELIEILRNGESSGVEFKRDDVHPDGLAKELVALANFEGGRILLGVEDDGTVSGLTRSREDAEQWVMEVSRSNVSPPLLPYWEAIEWQPGRWVGVVTLPADAPDKPYKSKRGGAWITMIRAGTTSRDASRDEEMRLYQSAGRLRYEIRPALGATLDALDRRRLRQYFVEIRGQADLVPDDADTDGWESLLLNTELMTEVPSRRVPSIAAILLFAESPNRFVTQAGIAAAAYPGAEKDYATTERAVLRGPLVGLFRAKIRRNRAPGRSLNARDLVDPGLIEQADQFVRRNAGRSAHLERGRRVDVATYPPEVIREAVVNAVVHRDLTITGTDVELSIYADRLEIVSPGRLPNTITVERMRTGCRFARNELLRDVMRDYGYIEATGLGVPRKILRLSQEAGAREPELIEREHEFVVRLFPVAGVVR